MMPFQLKRLNEIDRDDRVFSSKFRVSFPLRNDQSSRFVVPSLEI